MLSIIVPTMNRPAFIYQFLKYYALQKSTFNIFIADSSTEENAVKMKEIIYEFQDDLKLHYHYLPENAQGSYAILFSIKKMLEVSTDEFAVFTGDDDFILESGARKIIDFLKENPEYTSANGLSYSVKIDLETERFVDFGKYNILDWPNPSAFERVKNHLEHTSVTLFNIHRRQVFLDCFRNIGTEKDVSDLFSELFPCCMIAAKGPSIKLPVSYLIRGRHNQRVVHKSPLAQSGEPSWPKSLQNFYNTLVDEVLKEDGASVKKVDIIRIIDDYFNRRLKQKLTKTYKKSGFMQKIRKISPETIINLLLIRSQQNLLLNVFLRFLGYGKIIACLSSYRHLFENQYWDLNPQVRGKK